MKNFLINEGNFIGGSNAQTMAAVNRITASAAVTKGQTLKVSGAWTVAPAGDSDAAYCGIANNDAKIGEEVVVVTEGFVSITCSGAMVAGTYVTTATGGKVKVKAAATDVTVGQIFNTGVDAAEAFIKLK